MFKTMEHATPSTQLILSLVLQKQWADRELMKTLLALPSLRTAKEGEYVTAIIRHFHTVDRIFRAHLLGEPHAYTSANPSEPVTLDALEQPLLETSQWYVDYVRDLDEAKLSEALRVKFTDGDEQRMTRSDILLHVVLHGAGHRGNIGIIMRLLGAEPAPDRFSSYLRQRAPNS